MAEAGYRASGRKYVRVTPGAFQLKDIYHEQQLAVGGIYQTRAEQSRARLGQNFRLASTRTQSW